MYMCVDKIFHFTFLFNVKYLKFNELSVPTNKTKKKKKCFLCLARFLQKKKKNKKK